jgi:hypothetical protein
VAGTITVTVTGQGYTTTVPAFESSFTQNLITGSAMTMQTFTDFANNIGGTQLSTFIPPTIPNINGNQIFTETRLAPQGLGNNYSLTDLFSFTASGASDQTTATINIAAVPGPIVGAGLPGLVAACGGLLALARRRRQLVV